MGTELYNLILHGKADVWSKDDDHVFFYRDRFLEYTPDNLKEQFEKLDEEAIKRLTALPTLFCYEHDYVSARIGRITNVDVTPQSLRIYFKFSDNHHPLKAGTLLQYARELGIVDQYEFYRTHWAVKEGNIQEFYEKYLKSLTGVAHKLVEANKKVQLIYAFNASGKTRLSREFRELIDPKTEARDENHRPKVLYYNAFTEDLFYWDNDLDGDVERKLRIQPNAFTKSAFEDFGLDINVINVFQRYTQPNLTPRFNQKYKTKDKDGKETTIPAFSEVTFSLERGTDTSTGNLKISKGEESNFIWSVFYCLLDQVISTRNIAEVDDRETHQFNDLEYVFIDDPVSSLDDNHLIQLAVDVADLIRTSDSANGLKFIITTHNPLFFNVLFNEVKNKNCYMLERLEDGTFDLPEKKGDSNQSFSYHLYLKKTLEEAIAADKIERYHFTLLRNLYEKTSNFLGYPRWSELLPGDQQLYLNRIIQFTSHTTLSSEAIAEPSPQEKQTVKLLLDHLRNNYSYWQEEVPNA